MSCSLHMHSTAAAILIQMGWREKGVELTGAIEHQLPQHHAMWKRDQGHLYGQGFPKASSQVNPMQPQDNPTTCGLLHEVYSCLTIAPQAMTLYWKDSCATPRRSIQVDCCGDIRVAGCMEPYPSQCKRGAFRLLYTEA